MYTYIHALIGVYMHIVYICIYVYIHMYIHNICNVCIKRERESEIEDSLGFSRVLPDMRFIGIYIHIIYTYVYIYTCASSVYIYIYDLYICIHIYMRFIGIYMHIVYTHVHIYLYMYIHNIFIVCIKRERSSEREFSLGFTHVLPDMRFIGMYMHIICTHIYIYTCASSVYTCIFFIHMYCLYTCTYIFIYVYT